MADSLPDAFLEFDFDQTDDQGFPLEGESSDAEFPTMFQLHSFSLEIHGHKPDKTASSGSAGKKVDPGGAAKNGGGGAAGGGGDDSGAFPPVSVTMTTQLGSPWLMRLCTLCASGNREALEKYKIPWAFIYVRRAGAGIKLRQGSGQDFFLRYTLSGVTIASYKTSLECQDTFEMNYETMTVDYWRCDPSDGTIMMGPTADVQDFKQSVTWKVGDAK
jgi:type VI protein secretion system component Hcp